MAQVGIIPTISLTLSLAEARLLAGLLVDVKGGDEFATAITNTIKQFEPPQEEQEASESDPPKTA